MDGFWLRGWLNDFVNSSVRPFVRPAVGCLPSVGRYIIAHHHHRYGTVRYGTYARNVGVVVLFSRYTACCGNQTTAAHDVRCWAGWLWVANAAAAAALAGWLAGRRRHGHGHGHGDDAMHAVCNYIRVCMCRIRVRIRTIIGALSPPLPARARWDRSFECIHNAWPCVQACKGDDWLLVDGGWLWRCGG